MEGGGFDIDRLQQDAQIRWLKPLEILFILQNHEKYEITEEVPNKPLSGSLWLFNRKVLRFFRKDGYIWQKKKDGRTAEGHERLKVGDAHALNCYYARREQDQYFQRRIYWMLDPAYDHIVLVHYREISEGRCRSGSTPENTCSSISQRSSLNNTQDVGLAAGSNEINFDDDEVEGIPRHEQVSVHLDFENGDTMHRTTENIEQVLGERDPDYYHLDCGNMQYDCSIISLPRDSEVDLRQDLRSLENEHNIEGNKTTLWKDVLDFSDFAEIHETSSGVMLVESDPGPAPINAYASGDEPIIVDMDFPENVSPRCSLASSSSTLGIIISMDRLHLSSDTALQSLCTEYDMLEGKPSYCKKASVKCQYSANSLEQQLSEPKTAIYSYKGFQETEENSHFAFSTGSQAKSLEEMPNQENDNVWEGGAELTNHMVHSTDCFKLLSGLNCSMPHPISKPFEADKQIFSIREISPDWGFSSDSTKVIITGDFLSVPSESLWGVMFGDIEVPVEIIQDGVLRCQSPKHVPGIVKLYVTSGNLKPCSQIKEFKYVVHPESTSTSDQSQKNGAKTSEELLLLLRFAQLLLFRSDSASVQEKDNSEGETDPSGDLNLNNDEWHQINETVVSGYENSTEVIDWMLQQLLRDKLQLWLFSRRQKDENVDCSLTKQEKCMIHMISGLGYEWALNSLLNCGVGINFRDVNGWTALHWAARFGREKMVAALLAAGACPGAVTDPTSQDPLGKTAASISENSGYKGIAAYLSEAALTTHLSSLRIGETVGSLESIDLEAEKTWRTLSETSNQRHPSALEEQLSLEDSLTAVRNAAQAAARIQAAFRAHSFKKKQQELAARFNKYYSTPEDIHGLSAALRFHSDGYNHEHRAALCIQKKFRGWKRRRGFLALRHNVVKIQAHVRGHQVRKRYKEILWTVSVIEKAVLRWRRKGTGLRGFHLDSELLGGIEDSEEEDILKAFRNLKVDASLKAAVARVVSMVAYPEARQQYRRVLGSYRQFKAEADDAPEPKWNSCGDKESENDDTFMSMLDEWLNLE